MRLIARWFAFCLLFTTLSATAAQVEGLYEVHEPVASQDPAERAAAMSRALQTLVVRLTGDRQAAQNPRLQPLLADPQQLVQQYVYESGTPVTLSVVFDPVLSQRALREAGLSLQTAERASVLAWWLNEVDGASSLVAEDQPAAATLRAAAQNRGVPLSLPLGDLDEQLLATADTLAGSDAQALQEASARYAADALLAVVARGAGDSWQADWQLWVGSERVTGSSTAASQAALADGVLLEVGEKLASRFGKAGAAQSLTLEVQGSDLARYAALERLLEPFNPRLQAVVGGNLLYQVDASPDQLRSQLQLGRLHELPAEAVDAQGAVPAQNPPLQVPAAAATRMRFAW
ncbi:DUF2066 domain-containing protein [Pseudomonas sp. MAP12]|uniref:DUF2066 domain-containing protein n=1 Tax=Geopseudomonas aromaticivorans TaxID=2849492 RepID=A0ABS6MRW1_9GAMM|nr:DUF2066 domain-containing protein [Pseudomonas aromaticivorans]MBV2131538.1 DUF2066 domain-containing protein [Pseudomonas aromaticivorans]